MPYKKIIIIILAIVPMVGGVVAGSLLFPKKEAPKIEPPLNASQTERAFNNITSQAQSVIATPPDFGLSSSSISLSSSSSRSGIADIKQATLKSFDTDTSLVKLGTQDLQSLGTQYSFENYLETTLMELNPRISNENEFFYLKQKDKFIYIGKNINTVEKIAINNQDYWFIIQVDIFGVPTVAVFNRDFNQKTPIILSDTANAKTDADVIPVLFNSLKSVSGTKITLSLANGNDPGASNYDYVVELDKLVK